MSSSSPSSCSRRSPRSCRWPGSSAGRSPAPCETGGSRSASRRRRSRPWAWSRSPVGLVVRAGVPRLEHPSRLGRASPAARSTRTPKSETCAAARLATCARVSRRCCCALSHRRRWPACSWPCWPSPRSPPSSSPLRSLSPAVSNGVLYLLAVLLVSTVWGLWLGLLTSVISLAAFNFFHIAPTGHFTISEGRNWVALGVFFAAAVVAGSVADLARSRATEGELRRREADLAAALARGLLGGLSVEDALAPAGERLAAALDLPWAAIALGPAQRTGARALPLAAE